MKNRAYIFGLLAVVFLLPESCKEDQLLTYGPEKENNIYFANRSYYTYNTTVSISYNGTVYTSPTVRSVTGGVAQDSLDYTLVNGDVVVIPVMVMGAITDYDRKFAWRAIHQGEPNVGTYDVDFKVLDAFIPAHSTTGGIIVQLSDENLDEDSVLYADFELLPNENFETNFHEMRRYDGGQELISTISTRLRFTNFLMPPTYWAYGFEPFLGPWSVRKITVLVTYFNFDISDQFLYRAYPPETPELYPFGLALRRWLEAYQLENGEPYYEKDGTEMRAGSSVYNL